MKKNNKKLPAKRYRYTCEDCDANCCVATIEVFPTDEIYTDETLTKPTENNPNYDREMVVGKNNKCIALDKYFNCSIYSKRPKICRDFLFGSDCCKDFFNGIKMKHDCKECNLYNSKKENKNE